MVESIIIYHNPLEKAIWEGSYGDPSVPVAIGGVAAIVAAVITFALIDKLPRVKFLQKNSGIICSFVGGIVWFSVTKYFWIS